MSTPSEHNPAPTQYEPSYQQNPPSNPTDYQPLYNQPTYQQPYAQPYQQYQQPYPAYQGQPYPAQAPQYGAAYPTAYVVTPNTTYCAEDVHCHKPNGTGIGWILFIIGFFIPLCWLIGSFFMCSSNHMDRRSGRANLSAFIFLATFLIVFFISTS